MGFPSFEEVAEMLEEAAEEIPERFYEELNQGIHLEPQAYLHPEGYGDLYILGEYEVSIIGCKISIYYGSFAEVFSNADRERIRQELAHTLNHEFQHHMERRAGECDLEKYDEHRMRQYRHQHAKQRGGNIET